MSGMPSREIVATPLTAEAFAPFGEVIQKDGATSHYINSGMCLRHHDLATAEVTGPAARTIISIATGKPYSLPVTYATVERHPLGSQAFIPLSPRPFLVLVCPDEDGQPGRPQAFLTSGTQGVNYHRNVWHGVLTPLRETSDFIIVDREGGGSNLEEFHFDRPYTVILR